MHLTSCFVTKILWWLRVAGTYECKLCLTLHNNEGRCRSKAQIPCALLDFRKVYKRPSCVVQHIFELAFQFETTKPGSENYHHAGNYLAHTQGKRHQTNIARRSRPTLPTPPCLHGVDVLVLQSLTYLLLFSSASFRLSLLLPSGPVDSAAGLHTMT